MNGKELFHLLTDKRTDKQLFIKWRNTPEGIEVIKLLDEFYDYAKIGDRFDDVELLDVEDMWVLVTNRFQRKITRSMQNGEEMLFWEEVDAKGQTSHMTSRFGPDSLLRIFELNKPDREYGE